MSKPYIFYHRFGTVVRVADGKTVSPAQSVDDPDFVEYNAWAQAGNTPDDDFTVPLENEIPYSVKAVQLRKALNVLGLRDMVEAYVRTTPQSVQDEWDFEPIFVRDNSELLNNAQQLGINVDEVFLLASTL